ncbi:MAG TPA: acetyl-CoA C-acyltransferase [Chitinophagales bacterium]|nr:acetyl-CoA C-acyltransferase [Chitinophagales bacterium]
MQDVFVIDAVRTPIGKYGGALSNVRPDDMAALVIKKLLERNPNLDVSRIEEVIFGAANQAGEDNRDVARMALLLAGLPVHIGGVTVNRLCASGLQAVMDSTRAIRVGDGEVYLAGGVESMTRAPFVMAKPDSAFPRKQEIYDTTIGWRFTNNQLSSTHYPYSMGETAENVAEKYHINREAQDQFALRSQEKYDAAHKKNKFADEMIPVDVTGAKGAITTVDKDEFPRLSSLEQLAKLKPAFKKDGTVTAGNSSGINDGASVLLLASESAVKAMNLQPIARVVASAGVGVEPAFMGIGPVPAARKALQRAWLKITDIGLVELSEAFASQSIACIRDLEIDAACVNVNGGAIALGHPLGCSGARISTTLLHEMKRTNTRYGLATMCVGVGQGAAVIYERV